jgi:hypothetical protein
MMAYSTLSLMARRALSRDVRQTVTYKFIQSPQARLRRSHLDCTESLPNQLYWQQKEKSEVRPPSTLPFETLHHL